MENMEKTINSAETAPSFLQDFVQEMKSKEAEILKDPNMREHFESHGANHHVRPGNFSDFFRMDIQAKVRIAEHLFEESGNEGHGEKEDFHRQEVLAKLVAFYQAQEQFFALYTEAKDDEKLHDLAAVMESEMPLLKETYEKYMNDFASKE